MKIQHDGHPSRNQYAKITNKTFSTRSVKDHAEHLVKLYNVQDRTNLRKFTKKKNYNANLLEYLKQKHSFEAEYKKRNIELEQKRHSFEAEYKKRNIELEEKRLLLEEKRLVLKEQKLNTELERNKIRDEEIMHLSEKQHTVTMKLLEIISKE
ncbi:hypothetical protein CDAR_585291 [Caerostris darwini]|uniref:Uncharacterized protein n=1 Tax=Caerostris darwini TaxID=1538125 RepID=A0AAV4UYK7_9ARAC|nr:hypothetical protein CDAR_585291 [Caerostris darwini]